MPGKVGTGFPSGIATKKNRPIWPFPRADRLLEARHV
jgi:hypothetical protein